MTTSARRYVAVAAAIALAPAALVLLAVASEGGGDFGTLLLWLGYGAIALQLVGVPVFIVIAVRAWRRASRRGRSSGAYPLAIATVVVGFAGYAVLCWLILQALSHLE